MDGEFIKSESTRAGRGLANTKLKRHMSIMIDRQRLVILIIAVFILLVLEEISGIPHQLFYPLWLVVGCIYGWKMGKR